MAPSAQDKEEKKPVRQTSASKRQLQNEKRRVHNKAIRSRLKTTVKELRSCDDTAQQGTLITDLYSQADKAAKKGIFSRNKANRIKSRLASR